MREEGIPRLAVGTGAVSYMARCLLSGECTLGRLKVIRGAVLELYERLAESEPT